MKPTVQGKNPSGKVQQNITKPFAGKVFYLDLTSKLISEKLEKDIKDLGGAVEGFLSKEISYLITNKKEAKCVKALKYTCSVPSPDPAQNLGESSTSPSYRRLCQEGSSSKNVEKSLVSRGKSLVKKVIKEQDILPKNSILSNALNWGVKVLHVEEAKHYIEQKKRAVQPVKKSHQAEKAVSKRPVHRKVKPQKLKSPFLKIEDSSRQYRPLYLVLPQFRSFQNPISKANYSIEVDKNVKGQKVSQPKQSVTKTAGANNANKLKEQKEQKKHGYCECCLKKYDDLESHILSPQHKSFSESSHYQVVDDLISEFDFDFVDWSKYKNGRKGVGLSKLGEKNKVGQEPNQTNANNTLRKMNVQDSVKATLPHDGLQNQCASLYSVSCNAAFSVNPMLSSLCPLESEINKINPTGSVLRPPVTDLLPSVDMKDKRTILSETYCETNTNRTDDNLPEGPKFKWEVCNVPNVIPKSEQVDSFNNEKPNLNKLFIEHNLPSENIDPAIESNNVSTVYDLQIKQNEEKQRVLEPKYHTDEYKNPLSDNSPSGVLLRKVKTPLRNKRSKEEVYCRLSRKVSVPLDDKMLSSPHESLLALFDSSEDKREFLGFPCSSLHPGHSMDDDQDPSPKKMLWSLFSQTTTSGSSFHGF
ncbi:hypothetical protein GDO86_011853 [Hymenochirus boettgeri]|nr:hypothetical protein GDO86_011853 [Hymenochirus boettgeri]KAG8443200.1 hypothetical protein GDO86_011853 [Hymenochirus boettgeri]